MMKKHANLWAIGVVGACLALACTWAAAEVTVAEQDGQKIVIAPAYKAVVASDGCLTNLQVGGVEMLASGVNISRGTYFHQDGVLALPNISQPAPNVILADGDKASANYEFNDAGMVWTVKNKTEAGMPFFMVLAAGVEAVRNEAGAFVKAPVTESWAKTTWFCGPGRLDIAGATKEWGPWEGSYQVWEASLGPGEERRIELTAGVTSPEEAQQVLKANAWPPEAGLVVRSPRNLQVFQRLTRVNGRIVISGRVNVDADAVEVRITGKSLQGDLPGAWTVVPYVAAARSFDADLPLDAGGWYKLEARALKGGQTVAEAVVEQFGVGEVFVGTGQSNSTNCGQFKTTQTSGMVSSFSGLDWRIADDPQPGVHDNTQGGSFWPAFGDAMYAKYGVPIGVAVTGHGGTSVNQWQPDGELFNWMMTRLYQLGPHGFRGILWHQGESDVGMTADEYYEKLKRVILGSKVKAGWEFPWFVAEVSYHNVENPRFPTTREAQERLWRDAVALEGPDTDTLTGDTRDYDGTGIHFSPKGLKIHGEMWTEKVGAYLDTVLKD